MADEKNMQPPEERAGDASRDIKRKGTAQKTQEAKVNRRKRIAIVVIFVTVFSFLLCGSESLLSSILSSFFIITQNFKLGKKNFTKAKIGSNAAVLCGFSRFFRPFERERAAYHHINARRREKESGGKRVNGIGVSLCYQRRDDKSQRRGGKERGKDGHRREDGKDPPFPFIVRPAVQNSKRLRPIRSEKSVV